MGFRQSPFPMIDGTTGHKKELASPTKQAIGGDAGEAIDHWKKYKKTSQGVRKAISKKPASTLGRTTKAMQNIPKQFAKQAKTKMLKQVARKGAGRLAGGPVGAVAGLAYGAYKSGQKHSGGKAGSKEGQAKWKAQKEKAGKSDVWGKKGKGKREYPGGKIDFTK